MNYETETLKNAKFFGSATNYQQVFLNALSNAVNFSPAGGVVMVTISSRTIDHNLESDVKKVLLSVIVQD